MNDILYLKKEKKPLLKVINNQTSEAFQLLRVNEPFFFPSWHFHPECEIMLVLEGTGIRFVGDSIERFKPGDLVFFGRDIPHFYRSDEEFYQKKPDFVSRAIVLYFREDFLGETFWNLSDIACLKKVINDSKRGIIFKGKVKCEIIKQMEKMDDQKSGLAKVIDLLTILKTMSDAKDYYLLSSMGFTQNANEEECERINNVYQFIIKNYSTNPTLEEVSSIANMSITAFCRYFKSCTNKTYTQFLNEIKIGNACKLLIDNKLSISQICFEIGFNNFTHFNSQFKRIMDLSPRQYQQRHLSKTHSFLIDESGE
ncbi:MAG: AraC family transcriptional regulator [Ginsengibacter sp.]